VLDDANETLDYGTRRAAANPEGGNIVKGKIVLGVLAAIGILALSTTAAQAGAGGTPSPLTSFFVCHGIDGDDAGKVVDLESPVFGANRLRVKIGNGILACAFAKLFPQGAPAPIEPSPADQLKCYHISGKASGAPSTQFTVFDDLFGAETDVRLSGFRYLCGPASFFVQ
jgi:hypothetical protein